MQIFVVSYHTFSTGITIQVFKTLKDSIQFLEDELSHAVFRDVRVDVDNWLQSLKTVPEETFSHDFFLFGEICELVIEKFVIQGESA